MKDWFGSNDEEKKYLEANKIIIKQCVKLYQTCWEKRNNYVQQRKVQRKKLISEIEEIKEKFFNTTRDGVNKYVRKCPEDFRLRSTRFLRNWLTGFKLMRKNATVNKTTDIRNYFETGENHRNCN